MPLRQFPHTRCPAPLKANSQCLLLLGCKPGFHERQQLLTQWYALPHPPLNHTQPAPVTITKTITASKTTIETSTSTRIRTIEVTITIPASSFSAIAIGAPVDGYYISTTPDTDTLLDVNLFYSDPFALPSFFTLSGGNLYQDSYVAIASVNDYNYTSFQSRIAMNNRPRLMCTVTAGILGCGTKEDGLSVFYACLDESGEGFPPSLYFYPPGSEGVVPFGCYPLKFKQMLAT
jgi:hypothetical protein